MLSINQLTNPFDVSEDPQNRPTDVSNFDEEKLNSDICVMSEGNVPENWRPMKKRPLEVIFIDSQLGGNASVDSPQAPTENVGAAASVKKTSNTKSDLKRLLTLNPDLSKCFSLKANTRLALVEGQHGEAPYRRHPDTINQLATYFTELAKLDLKEISDFKPFFSEHLPLLAKLIQDSQVPWTELMIELRSILFPMASDFDCLTSLYGVITGSLNSLINEHFESRSYGHPEASAFSALACTFWAVKDPSLLGERIMNHYKMVEEIRLKAKALLLSKLDETNSGTSQCPQVTDTPLVAEKIIAAPVTLESKIIAIDLGTPLKRSASIAEIDSQKTKESKIAPPPSNAKISSFFTKVKKANVEQSDRIPGEYFQPFFVKPSVTMTSASALADYKKSKIVDGDEAIEFEDLKSYWKTFSRQSARLPNSRNKQSCTCLGIDGRTSVAVLKLLQFAENFRPAYLGTWRKSIPAGSFSCRNPFGKIETVDYDYESDQEWEEGEAEEGESLSSMSDSEESEESLSEGESEDSWLVPHGYLSDDEGVDEVHPGEMEEMAANAWPEKEKDSASSTKVRKSERKKFVPKEPVILGPFVFQDQILPQVLLNNQLTFLPDFVGLQGGPFDNYDQVFAGLESSRSSKGSMAAGSEKGTFPDSLVSSLIKIIMDNCYAGMNKLYDEFTLSHGKVVSRRAFESKLNQVTMGKVKCELTMKQKWVIKESFAGAGVAEPVITSKHEEIASDDIVIDIDNEEDADDEGNNGSSSRAMSVCIETSTEPLQ